MTEEKAGAPCSDDSIPSSEIIDAEETEADYTVEETNAKEVPAA